MKIKNTKTNFTNVTLSCLNKNSFFALSHADFSFSSQGYVTLMLYFELIKDSTVKLFAIVLLLVSSFNWSSAQCTGSSGNILTNPSFESPVVGPGNNFLSWPLGQWHGSGPASANIVNPPPALGGPTSAQNGSNYLEGNADTTNFWHDVVIPCDATVYFSGFFSVRDSRASIAKIDLYRLNPGLPMSYIGSSTTLSMPSVMNVWYLTSGTKDVLAGNYRFYVHLDDYVNIDNVCLSYTCITFLPIELVEFSAELSDVDVQLKWTTASESNNDFFTIDKSTNGEDWMFFANVDGAGNSNSLLHYTIKDVNPFLGINSDNVYYRLTQTDFDGQTFTAPIAVVQKQSRKVIDVYPNPLSDEITINCPDGECDIVILDYLGENVLLKELVKDKGEVSLSFLSPGIYFLKYNDMLIKLIKL